MRELLFAVLLAVAAVLVSAGAWQFHEGAGLAVSGVLLAGWSALALGHAPGDGRGR